MILSRDEHLLSHTPLKSISFIKYTERDLSCRNNNFSASSKYVYAYNAYSVEILYLQLLTHCSGS